MKTGAVHYELALHFGKHSLDVVVLGDVGGQQQRAVLCAATARGADQAEVYAVLTVV